MRISSSSKNSGARARLCAGAGLLALVLASCAGEQGPPGAEGPAGQAGTPCTLEDNDDGTRTLTCADGTSVVLSDGQDAAPCTVADGGESFYICGDHRQTIPHLRLAALATTK